MENLIPGLKPGQEIGPDGKIVNTKALGNLPPRVESDFDLLAAMKHVLANPPKVNPPDTEGEKAVREWLKRAPGAFMERMAELEHYESAVPNPGGNSDVSDALVTESDEELREAIVVLLRKHGVQS